jgi:hypothetical protein
MMRDIGACGVDAQGMEDSEPTWAKAPAGGVQPRPSGTAMGSTQRTIERRFYSRCGRATTTTHRTTPSAADRGLLSR